MENILVNDIRVHVRDDNKVEIIFIQRTQLFKAMFTGVEMPVSIVDKLQTLLSQALLDLDISKNDRFPVRPKISREK